MDNISGADENENMELNEGTRGGSTNKWNWKMNAHRRSVKKENKT
mgnify:CR=1 FL=1